jgi:CRISPR-associated protein Csd1
MLDVPASFKRPGVTPRAFFLWDNTAVVLGVSAAERKDCEARRLAFRDLHLKILAENEDVGLCALRLFLERWEPQNFIRDAWPEDIKDQNVVFALETERRERFLHQRPAARALVTAMRSSGEKNEAVCLVTGDSGSIARLHPAIKGVWGGQVAGGSIVSFNLDAFTSYGHEQGDNAPVSEAAAFAYTTALNRFLERDSKHRLQIGDASTVFWADAKDAEAVLLAEAAFPQFFDPAKEEAETAKDVKILLERLRKGDQELGDDLALKGSELARKLEKGVRFYVLGLAPNAARISIRFYYESDFGELAENYRKFVNDMRIEPPWREPYAPLWRYLIETAVLGKRENVPPNLAGEWMRSILNGTDYPLTLLSAVLSRIRADGEINALRASILKAILIRNYERKVPVALDPSETDKGYVLGRLFAVYEEIQRAALGGNVNATIKDKFYGSASATPRKVFGFLESGSANHLAKVRKLSPGRAVNLLKLQDQIMDLMEPSKSPYPAFFSADEQAFFGLGYHHQHSDFFKSRKDNQTDASGETAQ